MNNAGEIAKRNAQIRKLMGIFSCSYAAAAQVYPALKLLMNKYRVDRSYSRDVPCGMNSILYVGDSEKAARAAFDAAAPGFSVWGEAHEDVGIIMTKWDTATCSYVVLLSKGLKP